MNKSAWQSVTFDNPLSLRVDGAVGAMSISTCGRDAVLASRRGLYVIDLDDPFSPPRWLHHLTSWEVADVQWSPHVSRSTWVVSTSNQKAMVWNLAGSSSDAIEHVLHGHSRAITDINFHPVVPEMLATCSVDSYVLAWDLRKPGKPCNTFSDWRAGATQVKWNYKNPNIVASSHDRYVYIWDTRKGAIPLHTIHAHSRKINSVDFNKHSETKFITCSNDYTVKFWDYSKSIEDPQYTIHTDFPIWRARHLPFGNGCGIMPLRGGSNSVYFVRYNDEVGESDLNPEYIVKGHTEPVREFLWRSRETDSDVNDREYQLITWSKDCDLRLWPMSDYIYSKFDYTRGIGPPIASTRHGSKYVSYRNEPSINNTNGFPSNVSWHQSGGYKSRTNLSLGASEFDKLKTTNGAVRNNDWNHLNWLSGVRIGRSAFAPPIDDIRGMAGSTLGSAIGDVAPENLGEEVSIVGHKFPKVRFEKISVSTGKIIVSLNGPWGLKEEGEEENEFVFMRVEVNFPKEYPKNAPPTFTIEENSDISLELKQDIITQLDNISSKYVSATKFCLEPCLRYLMGEKISIDIDFFDEPSLELTRNFDPLFLDKSSSRRASDDENLSDVDEDIYNSPGRGDKSMSDSDDNDFDEDYGGLIPGMNDTSLGQVPGPLQIYNTPVPKGCGATWDAQGRLICFLICSKTEEEKKLNLLSFNEKGFSVSENKNKKNGSNSIQEDGNAANNLDSESESSFSDEWDEMVNDFEPSRRLRVPISGLIKSTVGFRQFRSFAGTNSATERSQGTQKSNKLKPSNIQKNVVRIYDFTHLMPCKKALAEEYQVLGAEPYVLAAHNSTVARTHGENDIADCWSLLETLLKKKYQMAPNHTIHKIDLFLQSEVGKKIMGKDTFPDKPSRFYWGSHPFGSQWLIKEIFSYYERLENLQMVVMLSCILFENPRNVDGEAIPINAPFVLRLKQKQQHQLQLQQQKQQQQYQQQQQEQQHQHQKEQQQQKNVVPITPYTNNFNITSTDTRYVAETLSLRSLYSTTVAKSRSIPTPMKTPSPGIANVPGFNWGGSDSYSSYGSYLSRSSEKLSNNRKNIPVFYSSRESNGMEMALPSTGANVSARHMSRGSSIIVNTRLEHEPIITTSSQYIPPKIELQMVNEDIFDLYEEKYFLPFLSSIDEERMNNLREDYAELLYYWNFPFRRLEVLKFNYSSVHVHADLHPFNIKSERGVDYEVHFGWRTRNNKTNNVCSFCNIVVKERAFICINCEHLMHATCAIEWWRNDVDECPSGCGCNCLDHLYDADENNQLQLN